MHCRCVITKIFFCLTPIAAADCFYPNGTSRNIDGDYYYPINPNAPASMCCRFSGLDPIDSTSPQFPGFCVTTNSMGSLLLREACTDPSWQDPACLKVCVSGTDTWSTEQDASQNDSPVTPCEDGSFCCGTGLDAANCCLHRQGVFVVDGTTTSAVPSSTFIAPTPSISVSSTPQALSMDHKMATGEIAAIVLGAVLGISYALFAGLIILRHWKYRETITPRVQEAEGRPRVELAATGVVPEAASAPRHELPSPMRESMLGEVIGQYP